MMTTGLPSGLPLQRPGDLVTVADVEHPLVVGLDRAGTWSCPTTLPDSHDALDGDRPEPHPLRPAARAARTSSAATAAGCSPTTAGASSTPPAAPSSPTSGTAAPVVADAVREALAGGAYVVPIWPTPHRVRLHDLLVDRWLPAGMEHVFFTSGGSESADSAVRLAGPTTWPTDARSAGR